MSELKPCPICCANATIEKEGKDGDFWGQCLNEECQTSGPIRSTEESATLAWNTRHSPLTEEHVLLLEELAAHPGVWRNHSDNAAAREKHMLREIAAAIRGGR